MGRGRDPDRGTGNKYVPFYEHKTCNNNGCGIEKQLANNTTEGKRRAPQPVLICPECDGHALELATRGV